MRKEHGSRSGAKAAGLFAAVVGLALVAGCQTVDTDEDGSQGKDGSTAGTGGRG